MANNGVLHGLNHGTDFIEGNTADVYLKEASSTTDLLSKPASDTIAETLFDGVAAVDTCLVNSALASADDGKYFIMYTQSSNYIIFADEDGAGASKPTVANASYYISAEFTDGDAAEVWAASVKDAINAHTFASTEVTATLSTATVTMTAKSGGACPAAVDGDLSTTVTISNTTPGTGDYDKATKTAVGQSMLVDDDTNWESHQGDDIVLKRALSVDFKMANFTANSYNSALAKYDGKICQVAYYDVNGTRKQLETCVMVINVKKIEEDSIPFIQFTGTKKAKNYTSFHAVYDMVE